MEVNCPNLSTMNYFSFFHHVLLQPLKLPIAYLAMPDFELFFFGIPTALFFTGCVIFSIYFLHFGWDDENQLPDVCIFVGVVALQDLCCVFLYGDFGVSKNWGIPKCMVFNFNGKPYKNGWFGGTTIFGNIHMFSCLWCFFWRFLSWWRSMTKMTMVKKMREINVQLGSFNN